MSTHHLHHGDLLANKPPTWTFVLVLLPILVAFCATDTHSATAERDAATRAIPAMTVTHAIATTPADAPMR